MRRRSDISGTIRDRLLHLPGRPPRVAPVGTPSGLARPDVGLNRLPEPGRRERRSPAHRRIHNNPGYLFGTH